MSWYTPQKYSTSRRRQKRQSRLWAPRWRKTEAKLLKPGRQAFYSPDGVMGKSYRCVIDSLPEHGWVAVTTLPGRTGAVSVQVKDVRVAKDS